MKLLCGFKYELLTTDEQRSALSRTAGCRRFVFNKALELLRKMQSQDRPLVDVLMTIPGIKEPAARLILAKSRECVKFCVQ